MFWCERLVQLTEYPQNISVLLEYSLALSVLFTRNRSERTQRTMNIGRRMMDVVRNVNLTFQVRFDTWFVQNDPERQNEQYLFDVYESHDAIYDVISAV